ncbi:LLM class flavin-dependent oxidoreductase [Actinoplanes sp. KI2]|uniref:LLM class flavin-dependent oxidoreductase n=1 Tax=Actinoplanes sp. KI2 TaxID=2983315 RepID=UPI0021D57694|nr:LLM class flavin-dependent oxidoreductase [Actinoplanes sp. KI2]MCU7725273.1 LLM class flavin-dependent oxidoreductase [Actinoplanes sp. KI2]
MVTFSLQAKPTTAAAWLDLARHAERAGFASLYVPDHPGTGVSPFVALAAAAAVTSRISLGSYVSNAGVREPILLASDVATLDVVSGGRAVLGVGAGHTPAEWAAVGRTRPDVRGRVDHCIEVAERTRARLAEETRVQERVPLLIGGGNTRLLRWAAGNADLIGLTGLGRTLEDGHMHQTRWRRDQIDAQVELCADTPTEALVQRFEVTDDAGATYATWAEEFEEDEADLAAAPYAFAGTLAEIEAKLAEIERRWGIARYAVRLPAVEAVETILGG